MYSIAAEDVQTSLSEILKDPYLKEWHTRIYVDRKHIVVMHCDIKTTKCDWRHGRFLLGKVYFQK